MSLAPHEPVRVFIARHPTMFRCGRPARIVGEELVRERRCFRVRYADGVEDLFPIVDIGLDGRQGGRGMYYDVLEVHSNQEALP